MANNLKALLQQAEAIKASAEAKGGWSEEDAKAFEAKLGEIDRAKGIAGLENKLDEIKSWAGQSDGQSVVRETYRNAAPMEGTIDGVTADPNDGTLYATSKSGEVKLDALKAGQYKDAFRSYIKAAAAGRMPEQAAMKVLQEGVDTSGGFWVPPDLRTEVVKKMAGVIGIRQNARVFTTGSDLVSFPKIVYTTNSTDDSRGDIFTAGTRVAWSAEAPTSDYSEATNPAAGRVTIPVHTAIVPIILTRALIEDNGFDLLGYISDILAETYALGEDYQFINGVGSGTPQGFLNHSNATTAHSSAGMYVASGGASTYTWGTGASTGLLACEGALAPQYDEKARWYGSKATYAYIRGLNATTAGIQWSLGDMYPNAANGYNPTLLGHPIVKDQFMPAVAANSYSLALGDMSGYYIADRVGLSIEVLREVRALRDEVVVYARKRVGGQLVEDWKVKLLKTAAS